MPATVEDLRGVIGSSAYEGIINSPDQLALHTYNQRFRTRWITIHDTAVDGTAPFNSNALAQAKDGTPFKRPENGQFRPGPHFTEFFDETGDTNANSPENDTAGGWASIFKLTQSRATSDNGTITILYRAGERWFYTQQHGENFTYEVLPN